MFGINKAIRNARSGISKAIKPVPRKSKPRFPTPANPGLVPKNDPFFKSKEFKDFEAKGGPATMDMYNSPYFGSIGSGSVGRAKDEAYRKFKNIPDPTPPRLGTQPPAGGGGNFADQLLGRTPPAGGGVTSVINKGPFPRARAEIPTPVNPSPGGTVLPSKPGGVGTTGFKSGSGGFASNLFGTGMKKGGKVKAISAPKASSASKKADGVAIKGKTKGRFV